METLESRRLMADLTGGLPESSLELLGPWESPIAPFPVQEVSTHLGSCRSPRTRVIQDSVDRNGDNIDMFCIKVEKRMKLTFDLKGMSSDADMVLYDANGNVMASGGEHSGADEHHQSV